MIAGGLRKRLAEPKAKPLVIAPRLVRAAEKRASEPRTHGRSRVIALDAETIVVLSKRFEQ